MKKLLSVLLLATMLLTLSACDRKSADPQGSNESQQSPENKTTIWVLSRQEQYLEGATVPLDVRYEMFYNENAVVIKDITTYFNPGGEEAIRIENCYNDHGDRISTARYFAGVLDKTYPQDNATFEYEYDEKGNCLLQTAKDANGKTYKKITYDANGNKLTETHYDENGSVSVSYVFTYDEKGNVLTEIYSSNYGNDILTITHVYDEHGNEIKCTSIDQDGYENSSSRAYTYDEKGNKISAASYNEDGSVNGTQAFTYDDNGNEIERTYTHIGDGFSEIEKTVFTYNEAGQRTKTVTYTNDEWVSTTEQTYDENGNPAVRTITRNDGSIDTTKYFFVAMQVSPEIADARNN